MSEQVEIHTPGDHVWTLGNNGVVRMYVVDVDGSLFKAEPTLLP